MHGGTINISTGEFGAANAEGGRITITTCDNQGGENDIILRTGKGEGKNHIFLIPGSGQTNSYVIVKGSGIYTGTWQQSSDKRFKRNVKPLKNVMDKIKKINGVSYEWRVKDFKEKNFSTGRQIGIIAQEVEKNFPELVKPDEDGYKTLAYPNFTAVLLEAIKEQAKVIAELKLKVERIEKRMRPYKKS
jgi:hypothetical protein